MARRLGVFCFYDENGIVDEFVVHFLRELSTVVSNLVILINGNIQDAEMRKLTEFSKEIYLRNNTGFDGGAYAHYFVDIIGKDALKEWDEVVLCNNSFFGPFALFQHMFAEMEKKEGDFWGIRYIDRGLYAYFESYFLVFRKKIINKGALFDFFYETKKYLENATYLEVCSCFERGIFSFLTERNYTYSFFAERNRYDIFSSADVNILKYNVPILKKKSLNVLKYPKNQLGMIMNYLQDNKLYDIRLIEKYTSRIYGKDYNFEINEKIDIENRLVTAKCILEYACQKSDLDDFIHKHTDIYIYGAGILAGNLWWAYKYKIKNFKGFIVSKAQNRKSDRYFGERVLLREEVPNDSNIIVALSKENTKEVLKSLSDANIILMWDMDKE